MAFSTITLDYTSESRKHDRGGWQAALWIYLCWKSCKNKQQEKLWQYLLAGRPTLQHPDDRLNIVPDLGVGDSQRLSGKPERTCCVALCVLVCSLINVSSFYVVHKNLCDCEGYGVVCLYVCACACMHRWASVYMFVCVCVYILCVV